MTNTREILSKVILVVLLGCTVITGYCAYLDFEEARTSAPVFRGIGASCCFPFMLIFLPTSKTIDIGYLCGSSYARFINYHVLGGLLLAVLVVLHAGLMMQWLLSSEGPGTLDSLTHANTDKPVLPAVIAFSFFAVITVTSLLRRWFYSIFRYVHFTFPVVIGGFIWHFPLLGYCVIPGLSLYAVDVVLRWYWRIQPAAAKKNGGAEEEEEEVDDTDSKTTDGVIVDNQYQNCDAGEEEDADLAEELSAISSEGGEKDSSSDEARRLAKVEEEERKQHQQLHQQQQQQHKKQQQQQQQQQQQVKKDLPRGNFFKAMFSGDNADSAEVFSSSSVFACYDIDAKVVTIKMRLSKRTAKMFQQRYAPGCYVAMTIPTVSPLSHPISIADFDANSCTATFFIKNTGSQFGWTAAVSELASFSRNEDQLASMSVSRPLGGASPLLFAAGKLLLCAGGIGITPVISILKYIGRLAARCDHNVARRAELLGGLRVVHVVWASRQQERRFAEHVRDSLKPSLLNAVAAGLDVDFTTYVTTGAATAASRRAGRHRGIRYLADEMEQQQQQQQKQQLQSEQKTTTQPKKNDKKKSKGRRSNNNKKQQQQQETPEQPQQQQQASQMRSPEPPLPSQDRRKSDSGDHAPPYVRAATRGPTDMMRSNPADTAAATATTTTTTEPVPLERLDGRRMSATIDSGAAAEIAAASKTQRPGEQREVPRPTFAGIDEVHSDDEVDEEEVGPDDSQSSPVSAPRRRSVNADASTGTLPPESDDIARSDSDLGFRRRESLIAIMSGSDHEHDDHDDEEEEEEALPFGLDDDDEEEDDNNNDAFPGSENNSKNKHHLFNEEAGRPQFRDVFELLELTGDSKVPVHVFSCGPLSFMEAVRAHAKLQECLLFEEEFEW